jgi:glycosyltransferase involved in cell wall biosynthesis
MVDYINLPWIRHAAIVERLHRSHARRRSQGQLESVVLTYNVLIAHGALGAYIQARYGVPWVAVVADIPVGGAARIWHDLVLQAAAGQVFLSWQTYARRRGARVLHLDGGVDRLPREDRTSTRAFLYAGSLDSYAGVAALVTAFRNVAEPNVELWICGKGDVEGLRRLCSGDHRITIHGAVSDARLAELSQQATGFVNPRPAQMNEDNFPSKLLEYLSYGKPVITTITAGVSPDYRAVVTELADVTPGFIATAVRSVLDMTSEERGHLRLAIARFLQHKLWDAQAKRLLDWLPCVA